MMRSLVIVVVLAITQIANSAPQFFGQSFASTSYTDSSGRVISHTISSNTNGKQTFNAIPEIHNDLLPPLLPNEIGSLKKVPALSLEVEPPPLPVDAPAVVVSTTRSTTLTTTTRPPVQTTTARIVPVQRPQTVRKFQQQSAQSQSLHQETGTYKANGEDGRYVVKGDTGSYRPKGNLGYYTHSNAGAYKPDDRGKYRKN